MERDDLIKEIKEKYFNDREVVKSWDKKDDKSRLETLKNGVYALYSDKTLLYIGMVSDARTASLYARFYNNGNASHQRKEWFENINEVYFYELHTTEKIDIMILERILIRELNPQHNDLYFRDEEIQNILKKM